MSTTTTAQPPATSNRLPGHRVITYALGDVANNLTFMMTSMFLMIYMTEIAGLSAGIAGVIYGVTKVWAGAADLIAGQTVDRFDTRWGRLRPWVLFGSTPLAVVFVLLFSAPAGLPMAATVAWIFLLDAAFQLAYSFVNIPYGSLSAAMTQDPVDRSRLSGARSVTSSLSSVILSAVVAPQFQDTSADGVRLKFTLTCLILGGIAVVLYLICFANSRETVPRGQGKISFRSTFRMLRQNRPLLILCAGTFFLLSAIFTMNAVGMYFSRFVLGSATWFTWLMAAQTAGSVLIATFVPSITVRIGKRNGYVSACGVLVIAAIMIFFLPGASLPLAVVAWFLLGIGVGGTNALIFSMQADTVDYGEWKSGIRSEGGSYSILSFIRKCGQGLGGWAGAAIIGAFGYVSMSTTQSDDAIQGIRLATGAAPAVLAIIALLIMLAYKLDSDEHARIIDVLNQRRTRNTVADQHGVSTDRVRVEQSGDGRTMTIRSPEDDHPPIITLFGQRGSGATDIAPLLAAKLGVTYIGQAFSSDELAQVDKTTLISDSQFSRWLRTVSFGSSQDADLAAASNLSANRKIAENNTATVLTSVADGGVLLGRNGALILGPVVGTLHVRLIAPLSKRIERVVHKTGLSAAAATEQCELEDRLRQEMSWALYQWNPNRDENYDLVINTASMTYGQIVNVIVDTYRSKYPENSGNAAPAGES
ncbi:Glucuronide carrier protein [Corynebacterium occultum]|uniref:Glucuronide carrier protein n=1 Tax=Corynebacterium occultum TaxID=2675219 RepID=A0A6B8W3M5_9CORY|nr:cytidylate kinase family protein [Corynebacterium occultum]QGU08134.1 Glucuronide carrier protein [Corynebacterium occultum]